MLNEQATDGINAIADNRRDSARRCADQHVIYYVCCVPPRTQERCVAKILDESRTGVGLQVSTIADLEVGDVVPIVYRCAELEGRIKYIQPISEGEWRVGVEWLCGGQV